MRPQHLYVYAVSCSFATLSLVLFPERSVKAQTSETQTSTAETSEPQTASTSLAGDAVFDPEAVAFFENRIRPVLVEHCYECHSSQSKAEGNLQGGLLVDSAAGLAIGGDSGPAIDLDDPATSLLITAMRYESFEMPPQGKLDESILADFETWLRDGAVDPRLDTPTTTTKRTIDLVAGRQHWAYQPITPPENQHPISKDDIGSQIDQLILAASPLTSIDPVPQADRRTLVRRLYFDLVGLPPSPDQIRLFVNDTRSDAVERLVDRLLRSPQFGQRWATHWLDLVRYAESVTLRGLVQQQAWRYRDYVIDALNQDLPYDQFLMQQVAGDLMPADSIPQAQRQHIATTFLTLGNNNLEDQDKEKLRMDVVDEQLNVIGSAFLAQTIGCARCHDHKFDPIPTHDYYALAGILANCKTLEEANVSNWIDQPLPVDPEYAAQLAQQETEINELKTLIADAEKRLRSTNTKTKSVARTSLSGLVLDDDDAELVGQWQSSDHSPRFIGDHYLHDQGAMQGEKSATFTVKVPENGRYEIRLSYSAGTNRSRNVHVSIQDLVDTHHVTINQQTPPPVDDLFVSIGEYDFETSMPATVTISNVNAGGHVIVDGIQFLPIDKIVAQPAKSNNRQTDSTEQAEQSKQNAELAEQLKTWKMQLAKLNQNALARPLYMAILEQPEINESVILIRGNVHQPGDPVNRGVLQVAAGDFNAKFPTDQSGRLQLAQWLAHRSNPLPSRVIVNRLWLWLLGEGLVRSPDNFGTTGQAPTHPQLLDYLAYRLIENNWSLKSVIREIVLSDTYQRSSRPTSELQEFDPENRWWLRQNRRRLDVECMIDAMLVASGDLDTATGGKTIPDPLRADYGFQVESNRRAIYWPVLRNAIPEIVRVFDGADPSAVTGKRNTSTVASQALLMMNNDWVIRQSQTAADFFIRDSQQSDRDRVNLVFESILGRPPSTNEQTTVLDFVAAAGTEVTMHGTEQNRWAPVIQSLWSTIDFRYLY